MAPAVVSPAAAVAALPVALPVPLSSRSPATLLDHSLPSPTRLAPSLGASWTRAGLVPGTAARAAKPRAFPVATGVPTRRAQTAGPRPQPASAPGDARQAKARGLVTQIRAGLVRISAGIRRAPLRDAAGLLDAAYSGTRRLPAAGFAAPVAGGGASPASPGRLDAPAGPRSPGEPVLTRAERNPPLAGVSGNFRVDISRSGRSESITAPQAAGLAAAVARAMPEGTLDDSSVTEILVVADLSDVEDLAASPLGRVRRRSSTAAVVDEEPGTGFRRVYLRRSALKEDLSPKEPLGAQATAALAATGGGGKLVPVRRLSPRRIGPLLRRESPVFVGGLISISAEPPEGFFAASTLSEFQRRGWRPAKAPDAGIWVYRVPDARRDSYFDFNYASPDRPTDTPRAGKFKVATGIGPARDPASPGGAEADLLWLGDEQHGALEGFLRTLAGKDLTVEDLYRHEGFVQRLSQTEVVVGGIDKAHALTPRGFDALETDPALYRRVFSEEYDAYLLSLFSHDKQAESGKSYLLATSRGCSQGCALCCSGGLSRFQYFSAGRMMRELEKIAVHAGPAAGKINVFFVDSNFNADPKRIIEFADLLEKSPLRGSFRFFVRHNTVNGFLRPSAGGEKIPNRDLIRAYARLGIREVLMGVDAYDDAGIRTLKTNWRLLARKAAEARPTYTASELSRLMRAFESEGLAARGFYLTNNPWVSDLDRIDSYYNLLELWLENPHFSIDWRGRGMIRLKPFPGSPITKAAEGAGTPLGANGRFVARTALGEIDEMVDFSKMSRPAARAGAEAAVEQFRKGIARVRAAAERVASDPRSGAPERRAAESAIRKLIARDARLAATLRRRRATGAEARLARDIGRFAAAHQRLGAFDASEQKTAFELASASLIQGLRELRRPAEPGPASGYLPEAARLDPSAPHTLKDVPGYLSDNLSAEAADAARKGEGDFLIVVGDGRTAVAQAEALGWRVQERLSKPQGFHQVFRAKDADGRKAFLVTRVNGRDRILHVQTLLRLAGLPAGRLRTVGGPVSWKRGYLETFRRLGHVPDGVLYGFANTAVDAILLRNKGENAGRFAQLSRFYDRKHAEPKLTQHDLDGLEMQVLEFENGKRLWLFNCMYGDLARDLMAALVEHGARNITFLGTAGALAPGHKVRDVVTPAHRIHPDGSREPLDRLTPIPGVRRAGGYLRVATPNVETEAWAEKALADGADFVEVELGHLLDELRRHPEVGFRAALAVSDVLTGAGRKDMTEWGLRDLRALMPAIGKIVDSMLGATGSEAYRVRSYRHVRLVEEGRTRPWLVGRGRALRRAWLSVDPDSGRGQLLQMIRWLTAPAVAILLARPMAERLFQGAFDGSWFEAGLIWAILSAVSVFHEAGHYLFARIAGAKVKSRLMRAERVSLDRPTDLQRAITLLGAAFMNLGIGAAFLALAFAAAHWPGAAALTSLVGSFAVVSLLVGIFELLPVYPHAGTGLALRLLGRHLRGRIAPRESSPPQAERQ
ncbi:MAG: hypothetical protein ABII00_00245 [Elusimicrobiota bacterium]